MFKLILIAANVLLFVKVISVIAPYQPDFDNYYRLVSDIRRGINPYAVSYMQNPAPPLVFFYFYPFTYFPLHFAQTLNLIFNLIAGYLTCYLLSRRYWSVLSLVLYSSFLSRYSLQIGQPILLIALLATLLITTRKPVLISLLTVIKSNFIFTIFSLRRLPISLIPLVLLSFLVIPPRVYVNYFQKPQPGYLSSPHHHHDLEYVNQTLAATARRLYIGEFYPYLYLGLLVIGIYMCIRSQDLTLGILFSLLLSPVIWQHYFAVLFPVYVLSLKKINSPYSLFLILTSFILWWPDLRLQFAPATLLNGLLASHFFFSLVLLTVAQLVGCHGVGPCTSFLSGKRSTAEPAAQI